MKLKQLSSEKDKQECKMAATYEKIPVEHAIGHSNLLGSLPISFLPRQKHASICSLTGLRSILISFCSRLSDYHRLPTHAERCIGFSFFRI